MSTRKAPVFLWALLLFSLCFAVPSGAAPIFHPIPDCVVLDTRFSPDGPELVAGSPRVFTIAGRCAIPTTAVAVALEATAFHSTSLGSPFDLRLTVPASPDFSPRIRMNCEMPTPACTSFVVPALNNGKLRIVHIPGAGSVHVVLTASGYFE